MKEINMLVWLTQLGLGVAVPLAGFVWVGVWLRDKFSLGAWCVIVFVLIGMVTAWNGLKASLKAMELLDKSPKKQKEKKENTVSFNDHD